MNQFSGIYFAHHKDAERGNVLHDLAEVPASEEAGYSNMLAAL
jgi:hypothetical protein